MRKVAMWNMIILLIYSIVIFSLIFLPDRSSDHMIGLGFMVMMMFAVAIHATINLFIAPGPNRNMYYFPIKCRKILLFV